MWTGALRHGVEMMVRSSVKMLLVIAAFASVVPTALATDSEQGYGQPDPELRLEGPCKQALKFVITMPPGIRDLWTSHDICFTNVGQCPSGSTYVTLPNHHPTDFLGYGLCINNLVRAAGSVGKPPLLP